MNFWTHIDVYYKGNVNNLRYWLKIKRQNYIIYNIFVLSYNFYSDFFFSFLTNVLITLVIIIYYNYKLKAQINYKSKQIFKKLL